MPTASIEHLIGSYWLDRVLPGVLVALVSAPAVMWIQHRALTRKIGDITRRQTAELKQHLEDREAAWRERSLLHRLRRARRVAAKDHPDPPGRTPQ